MCAYRDLVRTGLTVLLLRKKQMQVVVAHTIPFTEMNCLCSWIRTNSVSIHIYNTIVDALINIDVASLSSGQRPKRRSSDEDVYVEETYVFTHDPIASQQDGSPKKPQTQQIKSVQ